MIKFGHNGLEIPVGEHVRKCMMMQNSKMEFEVEPFIA